MPRARIAIHVDERPGVPVPVELVRDGVREVLATEPARPGAPADAPPGEVSVAFVDDEAIRTLNRRFLDRDRPTDVLAFGLHGEGEPPVGDVYVGLEQARRQADEREIALDEELLRLAIHGTLHVLGHDHPEGPERADSEMFRRQESLVRRVVARRPGPERPT